MLMVSGIGPAATLQSNGIDVIADRPGVGQNMWDHVYFGPAYDVSTVSHSSRGNPEFAAQVTQDEIFEKLSIDTNEHS